MLAHRLLAALLALAALDADALLRADARRRRPPSALGAEVLPAPSDGAPAPVSAALIFWLYGSGIFAAAGFAEEILPGLDFVPTATIAWFLTQSDAGQRIGEKVTPEAAPKKKAEDLRDGAIDV